MSGSRDPYRGARETVLKYIRETENYPDFFAATNFSQRKGGQGIKVDLPIQVVKRNSLYLDFCEEPSEIHSETWHDGWRRNLGIRFLRLKVKRYTLQISL